MARVGIYLIGARGNVGATAIAGVLGARLGVANATGLVTATEMFARVDLVPVAEIAIGGCDIVAESLGQKILTLADEGVLSRSIATAVQGAAREVDAGIDLVEAIRVGDGAQALVDRYRGLIRNFKAREKLDRVVVVNVATTERMVAIHPAHSLLAAFEEALDSQAGGTFTNAMLWAYAAFSETSAWVNFTPSQAGEIPALLDLSVRRGVPQAGKDGKTGETLLKTVLGPMFAARNLKVLSWLANNYLGNRDGEALADPSTRATKLKSKDEALRSILGDGPHLATDIGYAPSLGDWKTAWDLIHFEGFLGTRMTMQFTWQGCDSALAAPLVIDLARLVEWSWGQGETGPLPWLACFFKSPMGGGGHAFADQMALLESRLTSHPKV